MKNNKMLQGSSSKKKLIILTAVFVCAVVVINVIIGLLPYNYTHFDLTGTDTYVLADTTKEYLRGLEHETTVYVVDADGSDPKFESFMRIMDAYGKKLHVKWVSADKVKHITDSLGVTDSVAPYFLVVEGSKRSSCVSYSGLMTYYTTNSTVSEYVGSSEFEVPEYNYYVNTIYNYMSQDSQNASSYQTMLEGLLYDSVRFFHGEGTICSIIEYTHVESIPQWYVLTGHGEADFSGTMLGMYITNMGNSFGKEYIPLDTAAGNTVPDDAVTILVLDPKTDISESEAQMFIDFVKGGGQMTFLTSENAMSMPNLMSVMAAFGLSAESGIVSELVTDEGGEQSVRLEFETHVNASHKAMYVAESYGSAPVVKNANSILMQNGAAESFNVTPLITTSDSCFVGDNAESLAPRTVAAISENSEGASVIWFTGAKSFLTPKLESGSTEANDEAYLNYVQGNSVCIMGTVALLPITYPSEVTIPDAKQFDISLMSVNSSNFLYFTLIIGVVMVVLAVTGAIICYKRKKA